MGACANRVRRELSIAHTVGDAVGNRPTDGAGIVRIRGNIGELAGARCRRLLIAGEEGHDLSACADRVGRKLSIAHTVGDAVGNRLSARASIVGRKLSIAHTVGDAVGDRPIDRLGIEGVLVNVDEPGQALVDLLEHRGHGDRSARHREREGAVRVLGDRDLVALAVLDGDGGSLVALVGRGSHGDLIARLGVDRGELDAAVLDAARRLYVRRRCSAAAGGRNINRNCCVVRSAFLDRRAAGSPAYGSGSGRTDRNMLVIKRRNSADVGRCLDVSLNTVRGEGDRHHGIALRSRRAAFLLFDEHIHCVERLCNGMRLPARHYDKIVVGAGNACRSGVAALVCDGNRLADVALSCGNRRRIAAGVAALDHRDRLASARCERSVDRFLEVVVEVDIVLSDRGGLERQADAAEAEGVVVNRHEPILAERADRTSAILMRYIHRSSCRSSASSESNRHREPQINLFALQIDDLSAEVDRRTTSRVFFTEHALHHRRDVDRHLRDDRNAGSRFDTGGLEAGIADVEHRLRYDLKIRLLTLVVCELVEQFLRLILRNGILRGIRHISREVRQIAAVLTNARFASAVGKVIDLLSHSFQFRRT